MITTIEVNTLNQNNLFLNNGERISEYVNSNDINDHKYNKNDMNIDNALNIKPTFIDGVTTANGDASDGNEYIKKYNIKNAKYNINPPLLNIHVIIPVGLFNACYY